MIDAEAVSRSVSKRLSLLVANGFTTLIDEAREKLLVAIRKNESGADLELAMAGLAEALATDPIASIFVCRRGCNQCCHMAVELFEPEARRISEAIGVPLGQVPPLNVERILENNPVEKWRGVACSFLKDGECSIYEARPLVCRLYNNLSDHPELCDNSVDNEVPVLDMSWYWEALFYSMIRDSMKLADIRDWFPRGLANNP